MPGSSAGHVEVAFPTHHGAGRDSEGSAAGNEVRSMEGVGRPQHQGGKHIGLSKSVWLNDLCGDEPTEDP